MSRVTNAEVLEIMDSNLTDVSAFITSASILVDQKLADKGLPGTLLKEIERWLAAHFASIKSPRVRSEAVGGVKQDTEGPIFLGSKKGLDTTVYGQQVLVLDISGTLANLGSTPVLIKVDSIL